MPPNVSAFRARTVEKNNNAPHVHFARRTPVRLIALLVPSTAQLLSYCQSSERYFRDEGMATTKGCPINPAGICHLGLRAADNCKTTKSCVVRCSVIASSIPVTHKLHRALSRDTNRSSSRRSRRHHYRGRAQQRAPFQLPVLRTTPEWLHAKERDHDLRGGTEVMTDHH